MAYSFNGSSDYLINTAVPKSLWASPFSVHCIISGSSYGSSEHSICSARSGVTEGWRLMSESFAAANKVGVTLNAVADYASTLASPTTEAPVGLGLDVGSTAYYYVDGSTDTDTVSAMGALTLDGFLIGAGYRSTVQAYHNGVIAEVAIWSALLTAGEFATLQARYSPLFVRRSALVAYWPLVRDLKDVVGGYDLSVGGGSPSVAAHPRVIYPTSPRIGVSSGGAPPAGTNPKGVFGLPIDGPLRRVVYA